MRNVGTHRLRLQAFSITSSSFKFQLTTLGYEKTGPSLISQRLLELLLGTREKWPLVDLRVPSNDPENNCRTNEKAIECNPFSISSQLSCSVSRTHTLSYCAPKDSVK